MGVPPVCGGNVGGGIGGGRAIFTEEEEHGRSVHCDTTNSGTLWESGAEVRDKGIKKVVIIGGVMPVGGVGGGGVGGGTRCGGQRSGRGVAGN